MHNAHNTLHKNMHPITTLLQSAPIHCIPPELIHTIPQSVQTILKCGLGFNLPCVQNKSCLLNDFDKYDRTVRLAYLFKSSNDSKMPRLYVPNPHFMPPKASSQVEHYLYRARNAAVQSFSHVRIDKTDLLFTHQELQELSLFAKREDIVIKPADKNLGLVVMARSWYLQQVDKHLNDTSSYVVVPQQEYRTAHDLLINKIERTLYNWRYTLSESECKYLSKSLSYNELPHFYVCPPKIHKEPVSSRPIIPALRYTTVPLSIFCANELRPYCRTIPHILESSKAFVSAIDGMHISDNALLITLSLIHI